MVMIVLAFKGCGVAKFVTRRARSGQEASESESDSEC